METKKCSTCKNELPEENFWIRRKKTKVIRQSICKECSKIRRAKYHKENKDREQEVRNKRRERIKEWYINFKKTQKCSKCSDERWYILEFHHQKNKIENISEMMDFGIDTIKKEIKKCICLCANCHRELHHLGLSSNGKDSTLSM